MKGSHRNDVVEFRNFVGPATQTRSGKWLKKWIHNKQRENANFTEDDARLYGWLVYFT
jgi:hypothetical protein